MATIVEKPFRIVVGLANKDDSRFVIERALDTAARHERPELHFARIVEPPGVLSSRTDTLSADALDEVDTELRTAIAMALEDFGHPLGQLGGWRVHVHVRTGRPAEELAELAKDARADLIVVGRHNGKRGHLALGSVPRRLLESTPCSLEVVQPTTYAPEDETGCPDCVGARADSEGEIWFCSEHRGEYAWLSATWRDGWVDSPRGGGLR